MRGSESNQILTNILETAQSSSRQCVHRSPCRWLQRVKRVESTNMRLPLCEREDFDRTLQHLRTVACSSQRRVPIDACFACDRIAIGESVVSIHMCVFEASSVICPGSSWQSVVPQRIEVRDRLGCNVRVTEPKSSDRSIFLRAAETQDTGGCTAALCPPAIPSRPGVGRALASAARSRRPSLCWCAGAPRSARARVNARGHCRTSRSSPGQTTTTSASAA